MRYCKLGLSYKSEKYNYKNIIPWRLLAAIYFLISRCDKNVKYIHCNEITVFKLVQNEVGLLHKNIGLAIMFLIKQIISIAVIGGHLGFYIAR